MTGDLKIPHAGPAAALPATGLPLFYRQPVPLDAVRDAALGLREVADYGYARSTNSLPLTSAEFEAASAHYPIIFAQGARIFAAAVVGLRPDRNAFVDTQGRWTAPYIPSYVRRYPYIFTSVADGGLTLCVDRAATALVTEGGRPLFADGQPTPLTAEAMKFCLDFERQHRATLEFAEALQRANLLTEARADAALAGGEQLSLGTFLVIDTARFEALPDAAFLELRRAGWLQPIYAHLRSQQNWQALTDRVAALG